MNRLKTDVAGQLRETRNNETSALPLSQPGVLLMETKMARPPHRAPTLKDVADHAGVSLMTVSRTISANGKVKPATRERVQRAIAELNYSSDPPRRRPPIVPEVRIALLYSRPPSSYLSEFLIESLLAARHVHVHLEVETFEDTVPVADIVADLLDERTDGVILLPPRSCPGCRSRWFFSRHSAGSSRG